MTKAMTNSQMTKINQLEMRLFVIRASFVIRHSCFVIETKPA